MTSAPKSARLFQIIRRRTIFNSFGISGGPTLRFMLGSRRKRDRREGQLANARCQIEEETLLIRAGLLASTATAS